MRGGITGIRNIPFEGYEGPRLPPATQMQRLRRVIERELTQTQREIILPEAGRKPGPPQPAVLTRSPARMVPGFLF